MSAMYDDPAFRRRLGSWILRGPPEPADYMTCFDCNEEITVYAKAVFEDKGGNPICESCWMKRLEKAEAIHDRDR